MGWSRDCAPVFNDHHGAANRCRGVGDHFQQAGIVVCNATESVVQDNYVHHCGTGINCGQTAGDLIRRNIISDLMTVGMYAHGARGTTVECNVIKRFNYNPYKLGNYSGSFMCNGCIGLTLRNNVITESMSPGAGGPWPDCESMGIAMYGNTVYRVCDSGIFIEAGVYGTVLRWNTVFEDDVGIAFRANNANAAFENYSYNNRRQGIGMWSPDREDVVPKANVMSHNWVVNNGGGGTRRPGPPGRNRQHVRSQHLSVGPGQRAVPVSIQQYKDLASLRAELGQEIHGKVVHKFDPAPLGLVTFRVHGTRKSWEPIPMFGNPAANRGDIVRNWADHYFWNKGDFQDAYGDKWLCDYFGGIGGWARGQRRDGFVRQFYVSRVGPTEAYPGAKVDKGVDDPTAARSNGVCLQVDFLPWQDHHGRRIRFLER